MVHTRVLIKPFFCSSSHTVTLRTRRPLAEVDLTPTFLQTLLYRVSGNLRLRTQLRGSFHEH
jgi:hypothetical protein